jgi:CRP-like cAMP-binding protein
MGSRTHEKTNPPRMLNSRSKEIRIVNGKHSVRNEILHCLPRAEWVVIGPKLDFTNLRKGRMLHESGEAILFGTFVNSGLVSILSILNDGRAVDIGLIGKEGFVGSPIIAGFRSSLSRAIVQVDGTAFSIAARTLPAILDRTPELRLALHRYSLVLELQMRQAAACNRLHESCERLARWLLMAQDRLRSNSIPLTQEFLAQMLGIRRPSVSLAASVLQRAGVIRYTRGTVTILNRPCLETAACECYRAVLQQAASWVLDLKEQSTVPD